jgi:hypothetical protein
MAPARNPCQFSGVFGRLACAIPDEWCDHTKNPGRRRQSGCARSLLANSSLVRGGRIPVFQGKNREICWLRWPWSTTAWLVLWTFQLLSSCLRGVSSREFLCPNREFARACREQPTTTVVATAKWVSALPPQTQSDVLTGSPPVNARPLRGFSVRPGSHEAPWMAEPSASQIARGCKPAILRLGVLGRFARRRMSTDGRECYRTPRRSS